MQAIIYATFLSLIFCIPTVFAKPVQIATSVKPLHLILQQLVLDEDIKLILDNTTPHNFTLKPSIIHDIEGSDIVIYVNENFEAPIDRVARNLTEKTIVNITNDVKNLNLINIESDEHSDHQYHETVYDPHIWLSPDNVAIIAEHITKILSTQNPGQTDKYKQKLDDFLTKNTALKQSITTKLRDYKNKQYIVFHNAYSYFVSSFNFKKPHIITISPEVSPGVRKIKQINQIIKQHKPSCIIADPVYPAKIVKTIAKQSNIKIVYIDPIGGDLKNTDDDYFNLINNVANNFIKCFKDE